MKIAPLAVSLALLGSTGFAQISEDALKAQFKQVSQNKKTVISTAESAERAKNEAVSTITKFEQLITRLEMVNQELLKNISNAPLTRGGLIEYNRETRSLSSDLLKQGEDLLEQGESLSEKFFLVDQAYEQTLKSYTAHLRMYQENHNAIIENPNMTEQQKVALLKSYKTSMDSVTSWIDLYKVERETASQLSKRLKQALTFTVESIKYLNLAQTTANIGVNESRASHQEPLRELVNGLQERIAVLKSEIKKSMG